MGKAASEMPGEAADECASALPGGASGGGAGEAANERVKADDAANETRDDQGHPVQWRPVGTCEHEFCEGGDEGQ